LNVKQIKSSQGMQEIQPEIKKLQEKYSSKDAATQEKLQKETMALFQEHGVNPLAGCLPIFVQMPVLIAMYHAIMRTEAITSGSPSADNPQMKMMLYLMPIMITVFAFFFPAALALYWVVGNIFMVIQTIFIRKPMMKKAQAGGDKK